LGLKQISEDGQPPIPYLLAVDTVWRSTDPLAPRHRVQIMHVDSDEYGPLTAFYAVIGPTGHAVPFQPIWRASALHFIFGDAWVPDDTDLPAPLVTINGKLYDPAQINADRRSDIQDTDQAAAG
jgi:hypothetical protein